MSHITFLKGTMSKETKVLELNKCISSRLWYISLNIFHINNDSNFLKELHPDCCIDLTEMEAVIESLIHSPNEEQYQWIAYILLWKLIDNKSSNINCNVQCNIQIQLDCVQMKNAIELCSNIPDYLHKELLVFLQEISTERIHSIKYTSHTIFQQILIFLKESICINMEIVYWIINKLISIVPNIHDIAISLQDICFATLELCLERIPVRKSWYLNHEVIDFSEANLAIPGNSLQYVLCLLSKMDIDMDVEMKFLKMVCLSKSSHIKDIEFALYSRKNEKLLNKWLLFWNKTHVYSESPTTLLMAYKVSENIFKLTENFKIFLCEQELLERISTRKLHWLNDILDVCYILTMKRRYSEVESLLSCDLLKRLYPVLLFKALNDCPQEEINSFESCDNGIFICESISFFLEKCYPDFYSDYDLNKLHALLKSHVRIVEYILQWKKRHFIKMRLDTKELKNLQSNAIVSVKQILSFLQKHNVLFVLKLTINVHDQDHSAIQNLLKETSLSQSESFQAYCCIISALKAIFLCEFYKTEYKQITQYFTDMESYLSSLFPLSSRIETMESIFSLLFLRYEDFNVINPGSEDDDYNIRKSIEYEKSGFITSKYAVRDMLYYLWKSTLVIIEEIDKLQILGMHKEMQQLRESVSTFTSTLMDTRWKLKFYMGSYFIENIGDPQDESNNSPVINKSESVISRKSSFPHRIKRDTLFYKGDSTSDETKAKSDSSSESSLLSGNKRRKRSKNVIATTTDYLTTKDKLSLINLMLSSKESLILHCLWKGDFQKAQEVVEMFCMENTQLDGEIRFSEALHTFKEDISKYVHTLDIIESSKESSRISTLENIKLAAQEGVQSCRHINQLETFLASQQVHLQMLDTNILHSNEILALSVLDLSLTMGQEYQISSNLSNVAMKYLKVCETFDGTGHASFFSKIYQLFYENKNNISVTAILYDARIPLYIKEWRENNVVWSEFENNYRAFYDLEKAEILEMRSCNNNYVLGLKTIEKISGILSSEKYFYNIYSHLRLISTIIPDDTNVLTVSDLLKTSLHYYFGYQIFDLKMQPDEFERVASTLQVNLIYSILINACPSISYYNERSCSNIKDSECIILNQNQEESSLKNIIIRGPNQCASEILTELVQVLRSVSSGRFRLDNSHLRSISDDIDVRTVLNRTSSLASLDLSELSVGDETLTFFLNVWNIMFLHASLDIWSKNPPLENLRHMISLMSIGYIIGDLGLVTLAALRSKLLGSLANDLKFFTRVEELNELAWQDLDLVQNLKIIFAMANEFYGTPEIRVYEAQTLNDTLNDAARNYITYYSSLSPDEESVGRLRREISLPDLVRQYQNTFSRNTDVGAINTNNGNLLLSPIDSFEKLNEDTDVKYIAPNYTYEIILKYPDHINISSVTTTTNTMETLFWQTRALRSSLLQYLERHCWLLSYLIQRTHNKSLTILENNYNNIKRTACFENLLNSPWVEKLKLLFNNNQTLAAIHDSIPAHELWRYLELREDYNWPNSLEILNAVDDSIMKCDTELQRFKDLILSHTLSNLGVLSITRMLQYLYQIKDVYILAQTIFHNVNKWPMILCEHALIHSLHHEYSYKLPAHCKNRMNGILYRITIFHKMIPYCMSRSNSTWYDIIYCTERIDPFEIIKSLIDADQFELCLEWLECQAFSLEMQTPVNQDFLMGLLKSEQQGFKRALKFLQALPSSQSVKICKGVLKKLEFTSALQFIANYLLDHCRTAERSKYRKTLMGLEILKMLENKDRALYVHLIKEPLLMLEQLLMNCKFENIQKILNIFHEDLQHPDIGISNFDKIIRFYAKKSLDFRVSLQRDGVENKAKNISQSNLEVESNEFVMPVNVPTKEEWIPNDRARECGCCKAVIFSMFNRRHHCRRCGRVVCAVCSQHRMHVAGYPSSVLVRVCHDCKRQTVLQVRATQSIPSTSSSEIFDYWRLTRDERHNRTIREEFSFEYAPNISLCLAILNLHFDPKIYTSFLLDRCDEMKQLLQPVSGRINPEVDHAVIIKMIRSLLVAAKMKCAKLSFNTGLTHCDRFLSQVDLIAILVQSDYMALIPTDDLDEHTLRKLRDVLTEKEQWTLALDVSTKAGLDTQGVWAAWGKACLKVGHLEQAREKFHHCLDKIVHENFDDWVVLSYSKELIENPKKVLKKNETSDEEEKACKSGHSKRSEYFKHRPLKNPPLLTEILQILDNLSIYRSRTQHPLQSKSDAAQEILQTLNSLKAVSQNQFNIKYLTPANQTVYYQESLYYLLAYGSYTSILQFFLKHKEFDKCLTYILENDVERDLFLNGVYLYCLKNGHTEKLHNAMKAKDPTLIIWRKYLISVCHFMERKQYWHILYQIQLFMRDCIRASMTCIHFYINEANTYSDLHNRAHFLQDAQKHLESELQMESLTKRRKSTNTGPNSGQSTLAMEMEPLEIDRHINTICRQAEIAKFLANCEKEKRASTEFLNLFPDIDNDNSQTLQLPTLFGNQQQKIHLAILAILCGRNIGEGFGITFRIIQDYNLPQQKVYSLAGHVLALKNNIAAIEQLIKCCRSSGAPNAHVISDHVLTHCVKLLLTHSYSEQNPILKNRIDTLIRLIIDTELRINAYIESKQLKAAYLLAVKHSRAQDIRRILKEADRVGQSAIKMICLKWLQQEPKG